MSIFLGIKELLTGKLIGDDEIKHDFLAFRKLNDKTFEQQIYFGIQ